MFNIDSMRQLFFRFTLERLQRHCVSFLRFLDKGTSILNSGLGMVNLQEQEKHGEPPQSLRWCTHVFFDRSSSNRCIVNKHDPLQQLTLETTIDAADQLSIPFAFAVDSLV
jgi:hypothetical protein